MMATRANLKLRNRPITSTSSSNVLGRSDSRISDSSSSTFVVSNAKNCEADGKPTSSASAAAVDITNFSVSRIASTAGRRYHQLHPSLRLVAILFVPVVISSTLLAILDALFYSYGIDKAASPYADYEPSASFAVVINTYKRPDRLRNAVFHYAYTCGIEYKVGHVYVVWSELNVEPPTVDSFFENYVATAAGVRGGGQPLAANNADTNNMQKSEVAIIRAEKDSLNSRFLPIKGLKTDAIFMVDDDVQVGCASLSRGFDAWQSSPNSMVGYYPRLASPPLFATAPEKAAEHLVYHTWPIVYLRGKFNMILTKACFLHSKYLAQYSGDNHPQEIRDYIDKHKNCEDVAMSLLVANATKNEKDVPSEQIIYVEGSVSDTGLLGGISTGTGHMLTRSDCLTDITRTYLEHGWEMPLLEVLLMERSWLRHYPGLRWQIRPSNFFEWFSFGNMLS